MRRKKFRDYFDSRDAKGRNYMRRRAREILAQNAIDAAVSSIQEEHGIDGLHCLVRCACAALLELKHPKQKRRPSAVA